MHRFISALLGTVLLLARVLAHGQDFQKGLDAAMSGDYATALREWRPQAEQVYAKAQYNLGVMYNNGDGVGAGLRRGGAVVPAGRRAGRCQGLSVVR